MGIEHGAVARTVPAVRACALLAAGGMLALAATAVASQSVEPYVLWSIAGQGRGTPAADEERAYFLTRGRQVVALDVRSGVEKWRAAMPTARSPAVGSRLVVSAGLVIGGDAALVGLDRVTGQRRWVSTLQSGRDPGLYLGYARGGVVYTGSADGYLLAIDAATGRARWTKRVGDGLVLAPSGSQSGAVLATFSDQSHPRHGGIIAVDGDTGRELWRHPLLPLTAVGADTGAAGTPVSCAGIVIAASEEGTMHGLDARTGQLRWVMPPREPGGDGSMESGRDYRPAVCVGQTLVAGSLTGEVTAYDLGTRRERWRSAPEAASVAFGLAADERHVYVPYLSGRLLALRISDGAEVWRAGGQSAGLMWVPLIYDSRLLVAGTGSGFMALSR